jgi:hypothetical protein
LRWGNWRMRMGFYIKRDGESWASGEKGRIENRKY